MSTRQNSRSKNPTSEASLEEQVRLLTIENETLRKFIATKGFNDVSQAKTTNGKDTTSEKRPRRGSTSALPLRKKSSNFSAETETQEIDPKGEDGARETRARHGSNLASAVKNKSPNVPVTPGTPWLGGKGCSCKGNCSTRVCGCVKKKIPCTESCRCGNELCQNLESDKENIADPNHQVQPKLTLADNKESKKKPAELNSINKHHEKVKPRSIFSPDVAKDVFKFEKALDEIEFENLSLRFGENMDTETVESVEKGGKGSGNKEDTEKKMKKKGNKKTENSQAKNTESVEKQDDRLDPNPSDEAADNRIKTELGMKMKKKVERKEKAIGGAGKQISLVDFKEMDEAARDDEYCEPEPTKKGKKKAQNKGKANAATGKRNNRTDLDEMDVEGPQENEHFEPENVNKSKRKEGTKVTGTAGKRNNRIDSEEEEVASQDNDYSVSDPEPTNKSRKKVEEKGKATFVQKKRNNRIPSNDDSQDSDHAESEPETANKNKKKSETEAAAAAGKRNNRILSEDDSQDSDYAEAEPANRNKKKAETEAAGAAGKRYNRISSDDVSQDSDDAESESEPIKKMKKVQKKGKMTVVQKKRNNRIYSENDSQDNELSESEADFANQNKKNIEKKGKATAVPKKPHNPTYSEDDSQDDDHSESEPEPTNKNKKNVAKKTTATGSPEKKDNRVHWNEVNKGASQDTERDIEFAPKEGEEKRAITEAIENKNHPNNTIEADETLEGSDYSVLSPTDSKTSSSSSVGMNNLLHPEPQAAGDDFNPMKPRRQLSRSPIGSRTEYQPQRILDPSEILLPIPLEEEPEDEMPPPAELEKVIVDWDEHLANLVKCSKCARTFHLYRIKKHEAHCQKI